MVRARPLPFAGRAGVRTGAGRAPGPSRVMPLAARCGFRYAPDPHGHKNMGSFDRRKSRKMRRRRSQVKLKARQARQAQAVAKSRRSGGKAKAAASAVSE